MTPIQRITLTELMVFSAVPILVAIWMGPIGHSRRVERRPMVTAGPATSAIWMPLRCVYVHPLEGGIWEGPQIEGCGSTRWRCRLPEDLR